MGTTDRFHSIHKHSPGSHSKMSRADRWSTSRRDRNMLYSSTKIRYCDKTLFAAKISAISSLDLDMGAK